MNPHTPVTRRPWRLLAPGLALLVVGTAACDILGPRTPPDQIRVELEGNSEEPIRLVTSKSFFLDAAQFGSETGGVVMFSADTTLVDLPFTQVFPLAPENRFVVRAVRPDSGLVELTMRVFVDRSREFNVTEEREGGILQYYFAWN